MTFTDATALINHTLDRIANEIPAEDLSLLHDLVLSRIECQSVHKFTNVIRAFDDLEIALDTYRFNILHDE